jgi:hypothetical protein
MDAYAVSLAASKEEQWAECSVGSAESDLYRARLAVKRGDPGADQRLAEAQSYMREMRKDLHKVIVINDLEFAKFRAIEAELDAKTAKRHAAKARKAAALVGGIQ